MNPASTNLLAVLGALALGTALWTPAASAQDPLVALGRFTSSGTVFSSTNTVGGVVSSIQNGPGDYTVTVTATGAFAGAGVEDFIPEVTTQSHLVEFMVPKASVASVTDDALTIHIHTDDVEDSAAPDSPVPRDPPFALAVYRIPENFAGKGATRHLIAAGRVNHNTGILTKVGVDGIKITGEKIGTGVYVLTFTKSGAFAGAGNENFVPILSRYGPNGSTVAIRGSVTWFSSDEITVRVQSHNMQSFAGGVDQDITSPTNGIFHFSLYQIPATPDPRPAKSRMLVSLGRVSSMGQLESGGTYGNGTASAEQTGTGAYRVTITSPGAFAGRSSDEFIPQLTLRQNGSFDRVIRGSVEIANANTLTLDVYTTDAEVAGSWNGLAVDASFYFTLYDAVADYQPDLRIGRKAALAGHKGDNIHNGSGAGQQIRVKLRDKKNGAPKRKKYFFLAENDGNAVDNLRLRTPSPKRLLRMRFFRLTGGRQNVTAALRTGTLVLGDLRPGEQVQFQSVVKFKKNARKKRKKIATRSHSLRDASRIDVAKAKLVRKTR